MHRTELITAVINATQLDKKAIEKAVEATFSQITEALAEGEEIRLSGFGTFKVNDRKAKQARNPRTGELIQIPATKVVAFKAGKELKDKVKG